MCLLSLLSSPTHAFLSHPLQPPSGSFIPDKPCIHDLYLTSLHLPPSLFHLPLSKRSSPLYIASKASSQPSQSSLSYSTTFLCVCVRFCFFSSFSLIQHTFCFSVCGMVTTLTTRMSLTPVALVDANSQRLASQCLFV